MTKTNESTTDDLEYNDGLGDLLREKDQHQFSWAKTTLVLLSIIIIVFIGLTVTFKVGKAFLLVNKPAIPDSIDNTVPSKKMNISTEIASIEKESENFIKKNSSLRVNVKKATQKPNFSNKAVSYKIIAGSFNLPENALFLRDKLKKHGFSSFIWEDKEAKKASFKVQVGAFGEYASAIKFLSTIKNKGFQAYILQK